MGCGGSAQKQRQEDSASRYEAKGEPSREEAPPAEPPPPSLTATVAGAADAGGTAEAQYDGVTGDGVSVALCLLSEGDSATPIIALPVPADSAKGSLLFELTPLALRPGEQYELRLGRGGGEQAAEGTLARCALTLSFIGVRSPEADPQSPDPQNFEKVDSADQRSTPAPTLEASRVGSLRSMVSTLGSSVVMPGGEWQDEDADEQVTRHIQRLREQALAEVRGAGSVSGLRVNGVNPARIGAPTELSARDLARVRRWADYLPPFDPIPALEVCGDSGRPPRAHMLKANQDLLDAYARDKAKIHQQLQASGRSDASPRSASPTGGGAAQTDLSLATQGRPSTFGRSGAGVGGSEPSAGQQRRAVKASGAVSPTAESDRF